MALRMNTTNDKTRVQNFTKMKRNKTALYIFSDFNFIFKIIISPKPFNWHGIAF